MRVTTWCGPCDGRTREARLAVLRQRQDDERRLPVLDQRQDDERIQETFCEPKDLRGFRILEIDDRSDLPGHHEERHHDDSALPVFDIPFPPPSRHSLAVRDSIRFAAGAVPLVRTPGAR